MRLGAGAWGPQQDSHRDLIRLTPQTTLGQRDFEHVTLSLQPQAPYKRSGRAHSALVLGVEL